MRIRVMRFFDKLEDRVRGWLSHRPLLYAMIGGIGTVMFWRGVWHSVDFFAYAYLSWNGGVTSIDYVQGIDAIISLVGGMVMLLMTGLWVTNFIGNEIIISGLRGEKKLSEKTEYELKTETGAIARIEAELRLISARLEVIEDRLDSRKKVNV